MVCSLNLQGYIKDELWTERPFYIASLAKLAEPGALFDPDQTGQTEAWRIYLLPNVPVIGHVVTILTLNTIYGSVAEWLTAREPHVEAAAAQRSMQLKRFLFEAFDCYIALFYLAFVQCDIRKLRTELISIYTVDSIRRIVTEALLPWLMQAVSRQRRGPEPEGAAALTDYLEKDEHEIFDDFLESASDLSTWP